MDKYHVGQKVRVKWALLRPELKGKVITITGPRVSCQNSNTYWHGYQTDVDGFCPQENQLEPADDEVSQ